MRWVQFTTPSGEPIYYHVPTGMTIVKSGQGKGRTMIRRASYMSVTESMDEVKLIIDIAEDDDDDRENG